MLKKISIESFNNKINNFKRLTKNNGISKTLLFSSIYLFYYIHKSILQRKITKNLKIQLFNNKYFHLSSKDTGLSFDLFIAKIREPIATEKTIKILKERVSNNRCFLDIGANLGYYTIVLGDLFSEIICIEPNKQAVSILRKNLEENGLNAKTKILIGAISNNHRPLYMKEKPEFNLSEVSISEGNYPLQTYLLVDTLQKYQPTFVKMDIEGFEFELFNDSLLSHKQIFPNLLFMEIHFDKKSYTENLYILKVIGLLNYKIKYAIWEVKGPQYLSYKYSYWKKLFSIIKKIQLGSKGYVIAQDLDIESFSNRNIDCLNGKYGAIEFIFEKID